MATVKLRQRTTKNKDGTQTILIIISQKGEHTSIPTKYAVEKKYFKNERIVGACKNVGNVREANLKLSREINQAWDIIEELEDRRIIERMSAVDIANYIRTGGKGDTVSFTEYLEKYVGSIVNKNTKEKYQTTANVLQEMYKRELWFDEINKSWLYEFKIKRLEEVASATVNIDLRNIRAIFNRAIDIDEIISRPLQRNFSLKKDKLTP